ncbi:hypothetical protein F4859DRAFT_499383 [Xylaria cf. heliscus]|nr:hypothetical protein F4859DRAFT_499383 [Xylaria cf. heliscus]
MSPPPAPVNNSNPEAVVIRPPLSRPPAIFHREGEIKFCHPGYNPPCDTLFMLPRLDHSSVSSASSLKGVHYGTALTACQIIANNAFDGYLATDREGRERVDLNLDHLLTESQYWFFTGSAHPNLNPYPIIPSFQDWAFPHQEIARWSLPTDITTEPDMSGPRCIITQTAALVNKAHLIPAADENWYKVNVMSRYGNHHDINQKSNKITLRHDLHYAFDSHLFAIVPKQNHYVVHQLSATESSTREFASIYHNRRIIIQQSIDVVPAFLFARFARAVFILVKPFIAQSPIPRYVARLHVGDKEGVGDYSMKSEWLSPQQLADQYGGGGTKSASPSKRKRNNKESTDDQEEYEDYNDNDCKSDNDNSDLEGEWYEKNVGVLFEDGSRSRKRQRHYSGSDSDTEGEWYEKNVAVLLEDRGRSQKRRCDDSDINNPDDSQPPSLSTSISSIQPCPSLDQEASCPLPVEAKGPDLSKGIRAGNTVELEPLC